MLQPVALSSCSVCYAGWLDALIMLPKETFRPWGRSPIYCPLVNICCGSWDLPTFAESKPRFQGWMCKRNICIGRGVIKTKPCALPKRECRIIFSLYISLCFSLMLSLLAQAGCTNTDDVLGAALLASRAGSMLTWACVVPHVLRESEHKAWAVILSMSFPLAFSSCESSWLAKGSMVADFGQSSWQNEHPRNTSCST